MEQQYGRYNLQQQIGQGGMSRVFLAHDPRFGRQVALKVMSYALRDHPAFRGRFEREARTVAALEHPAIVPVYDFGEDHEQLYLVMRYMKGGTLGDRIPLQVYTPEMALPIVRRIGDALDYAHRQGVVHRDLKPGNILFDQFGNAFLSDFGIVKLADGTHTSLTGSGMIGTPAYMSPEQIHGELELDGRSDIYTLGIILYEMLTGRKPFRGETPVKQMMAHLLTPIPDARRASPELPEGITAIIDRVLAKDRDERYQLAEELTGDLLAVTGAPLPPFFNSKTPQAAIPPPVSSNPDVAVHSGDVPDGPTVTGPLPPPPSPAETADLPDMPAAREPTGALPAAPAVKPRRRLLPWAAAGVLLVLLLIMWPRLPFNSAATPAPTVETGSAAVAETATATATPTATATSPPPTPTPTTEPTASVTPAPFAAPPRITFGVSALGAPLEYVRFGDGVSKLLLVGGIHAGFAPGSVELAELMITHFSAAPQEIPGNITLLIVPNANPDSPREPGELIGRLNGNGVDLNRNWDCRWLADPVWQEETLTGGGGTTPFSEPEIAALVDLIAAENVQAVVFWQARATQGLASPGVCGAEPLVSRPLAQVYGRAAGYGVAEFEVLVDRVVNGDGANWLDSQGIPAVSVLLPEYETADPDANLTGVRAVLEWLSAASGPR